MYSGPVPWKYSFLILLLSFVLMNFFFIWLPHSKCKVNWCQPFPCTLSDNPIFVSMSYLITQLYCLLSVGGWNRSEERSAQVAYSSWVLLSAGIWVVLWGQRFSLIRVRIAGDKERFIRFGNQSCRQWEWPVPTRKGSLFPVVSPTWENSSAPHKPHSLPASNARIFHRKWCWVFSSTRTIAQLNPQHCMP